MSVAMNVARIGRAWRAYRDRVPGFYVVNRETGIAVAGPFSDEERARERKTHIDAPYVELPGSDVLHVERVDP
jgi:hypothetical protein